jgi:hypothetical protein
MAFIITRRKAGSIGILLKTKTIYLRVKRSLLVLVMLQTSRIAHGLQQVVSP